MLQFNSPNSALAGSGCTTLVNYSRARQLAYALGLPGGSSVAATNHTVTAYTENIPGADSVEFQTVGQLSLPTTGRFLTFQVDGAALNCGVSAPR